MENNFTDTELAHEQWRDIDGYDGMYQVSDLGRVRSLKYGKVRVLKGTKDKDGYLLVSLCKGGKIKKCRVHRLVASAFITNNDDAKNEINHKNEIKSDNRLWNIEYCTAQYNKTYNDLHHRRNTKRRKIKHLYDPNLSINENIKVFKEQGVECGGLTIIRLRKELGLTRKCTKRS